MVDTRFSCGKIFLFTGGKLNYLHTVGRPVNFVIMLSSMEQCSSIADLNHRNRGSLS